MRTLLALALLIGCTTDGLDVASRSDEVVYGDDDRVEVFEHPNAFWRTLAAESIVALVNADAVDASDPADVQLRGGALGATYDLCSDERFIDQPTPANCSGTLIDVDLVLTAGHCVTSAGRCASTRFVFDFFYEADGELKTINAAEDVYSCAELVAQQNTGALDYAVIRLDRPVAAEHAPAAVRTVDTALSRGDGLVVLGFGSGLPLKIDDGGEVTNPRAASRDWFGANLDTFGGNSGSGVFNDDGELVGILVRGEGDYAPDGRCNRVRLLPNLPGGGLEEECTYVARALDDLCDGASSALCEGGGLCQGCRVPDDCPAGFACDMGVCLPTCAAADCPMGTTCTDEGLCEPEAAYRCEGNNVTETRCGRSVGVSERCGGDTYCSEGACIPLPPGASCDDAIEVEAVDQRLTGTHIQDSTNSAVGSCGGNGRDTVYNFTLTDPTRFRAEASNFDATLHLRRGRCDDPAAEIACDDDSGSGRGDALLELELTPGTYYLFMDNFYRRSGGPYTLDLAFEAGDPPVDAGTPRDDAGGPPFDGGPGFDGGPFDAGPAFDVGPRTDAGADAAPGEVQLLKYGCDCRVSGGERTPPLSLLGLLGLVALRMRRRSRR